MTDYAPMLERKARRRQLWDQAIACLCFYGMLALLLFTSVVRFD